VFDLKLADIWREKITCIIHTSTQEEADMLFKAVDSYDHNGTTWASWWNVYKEKTCYRTNLGEVVAYGCIDNYIEDGEKVIEFSDLVATGGYCNGFRGGKIPTPSEPVPIEEQFGLPKGVSIHDLPIESLYRPMNIEIQPLGLVCNKEQAKNIAERLAKELNGMLGVSFTEKEEKKMSTKFTFYVTEGYRMDKFNNTKIPTITTEVLVNGVDYQYSGSATCDKADYSERDGILNAIANAVCCGNFDREYEKFLANKKRKYDESCKCKICGRNYYEDEKTGKRTPFTPEDARKHEEWHEQNKKNKREKYLIRKEAKRRLAEAEREGKIEQTMKELYKK
jgi:hypothetical protein